MTVPVLSKVYYRPSRRAPYFNQWASPEGDNGAEDAPSNERNTSVPSVGDPLRRKYNSVQAFGAMVVDTNVNNSSGAQTTTSSVQTPPRAQSQQHLVQPTNNNNEADAAAGGIMSRARGGGSSGSSFQLLARSTSHDTLMRSPTGTVLLSPSNQLVSSSLTADPNQGRSERQQQQNRFSQEIHIQPDWRLRDRMKTVGIGLILALNIGTDPPDIVKPNPCAVLQCWMDPRPNAGGGMTRAKAKEMIGDRLERQYSKWQLARTARPLKYRKALDPTVDDVRNLCIRLRSQAKNERILIHYNGQGVPRPTDHGEIWVFDKNHTEYIPLSVSDLRQWMGKPSIVVLDCSSAGILIPFFRQASIVANAAEQQKRLDSNERKSDVGDDEDDGDDNDDDKQASEWVRDTIILCPCSENEWLPMHPDYPADIFTSCLTTPIPIALRWFVRQQQQHTNSFFGAAIASKDYSILDNIPGKANDRKTPLGELNWIFTAVTDSIAWNVLPKPLFQRLFRQDLLVASMFRNFLLADRILRSFGCTPVSYPPLPGTSTSNFGEYQSATTNSSCMAEHPLWQAWDLACETMLFQLMKDGILTNSTTIPPQVNPDVSGSNDEQDWDGANTNTNNPTTATQQQQQQALSASSSVSSPFFSEQLTAFEIWLELASVHKMHLQKSSGNNIILQSPEQLPVVLQVLLSQVHRIRALKLLQQFLGFGPWAVNLALSLGIFPYVMKLLQSPEYKSLLVSIWASILAFDSSCRVDVLKDGAIHHFVQHLLYGLGGNTGAGHGTASGDAASDAVQSANQRTLAAFVLAAICYEYPAGQAECVRLNLHGHCCALLSSYEQGEQQNPNRQQTAPSQPQHDLRQNNGASVEDPVNNDVDSSVEGHLPAHFRLWLCLCLANMVKDNTPMQNEAYSVGVNLRLEARLKDKSPDVRAAACYTLGCLVGSQSKRPSSRSSSIQDMASLQVSQQQQQIQRLQNPPFVASSPPGFAMPQRLTPSGPVNLTLSNNVAIGMTSLPGQLHPSFAAPVTGSAGAPLSAAQLQQPMHPIVPNGIQHPQAHPVILQQQQQPVLQQHFWNQQQQQQMLQQRQQQQLQYMLHQQGHMHQSQMPVGVQQYPQHMVAGGFLVNPGSGGPIVLSHHHGQSQMMGMPLNAGQVLAYHQQQHQQFSPNPLMDPSRNMMMAKPTVFEDRSRLELDLLCLETLLEPAVHDGSVVVRYEATLALGGAVGKYLEAFVIVAEEMSAVVSSSTVSSSSHRTTTIHPPRGLDRNYLDRFTTIWKTVRRIQKEDSFPPISKAANAIVRVVHDLLLRCRMESEKQAEELAAQNQKMASLLSGIDEEQTPEQPSFLKENVEGEQQGMSRQIANNPNDLLRVVSESASGSNMVLASMKERAVMQASQLSNLLKTVEHGVASAYALPKSEFYAWKKSSFEPNFDFPEDDEHPDPDPLSPTGAARAYQDRRNFVVRENGVKLARRYASLAPKPPEPKKKSIELILEHEDETVLLAAEEEASLKKSELELKEKKLFRNDGIKMTSLVKFHRYEDYLMACGATDVVTLWDTESGKRLTKFENGNPKGSRMSSSFWINEESSSLFLVGCDDGTVKIWSNILESNGESCSTPPSLVSAFLAAPMEAGHWDSGLVLEWQPFSGTLLAGGNSKLITCWDLDAEKIANRFDTNCEAYVTTLTTAWDFDNLGIGSAPQGYHGIGRDIVVAGHSDGSLRIFDIRMNGVASDMRGQPGSRRQRQRATAYNEHKNWVVNAAFTSYSNRYELISGTVSGEIKAWDLRMSTSIRTVEVQRSTMTTFTVHPKIPIVATGSHAQFIKVLTLDGDTMQVLRYHEKMASHRIGPVSCLEFHPNKPLLAAGAVDTYIGLYTTKQHLF